VNESPIHDDAIREQLEAYALGALDPDNATEVREHLAGCLACRGHLAELERAAATLTDALSALGPAPPAELKTRVITAIEDELAPVDRNERRQAAALKPTAVNAVPQAERPSPRRFAGNLTTLARLVAAAVVIVALGWSFRLADALEQERALREEFAALVSQQEVVLEVVDSDKSVRRVLLTTAPESCEPGTCSYGKLFTRTDLRHVVAMAARLPPPPNGQAYRLWLTTEGRSEPVGTMTLDDKGFGLLVFDADEVGPIYSRAELVLQPEQSQSPAGDVVLLWTPSSTT
jgi:hypothetical protein